MSNKFYILISLFSTLQSFASDPFDNAELQAKVASSLNISVQELQQSFYGQNQQFREFLATFSEDAPEDPREPIANAQFKADAAIALELSMLPDFNNEDVNAFINDELLALSIALEIDVGTLRSLRENDKKQFDELRNQVSNVQTLRPIADSRLGSQKNLSKTCVRKDPSSCWKAAAANFKQLHGKQNLNLFYDAFSVIYGCGNNGHDNSPGVEIKRMLLAHRLSENNSNIREQIFEHVAPKIFVIKQKEEEKRNLTQDEVETIVDYILYNEF